MDEGSPYISVDQLAQLLGVEKQWIYAAVKSETIPYFRLGRQVRFDVREIRAWTRSNRAGPAFDLPDADSSATAPPAATGGDTVEGEWVITIRRAEVPNEPRRGA